MRSQGTLQENATRRLCILEPDHTIGRAPPPATCLHLDKPYVSGVHAALRWIGDSWILRDLGSRNGTYLDGDRIASGEERKIRLGARIGFGGVDEAWTLVDDAPPRVMVVPVAGGDPVLMGGDLLALPSAEDPRVTIYRADGQSWMLEQATEPARGLANRDTFDVDGTLWRFCCLDLLAATIAPSDLAAASTATVCNLHLEFAVSRNEEFVQLHVAFAGRRHDLGSRTHNYLLLTLARRRLADAAEGLADTSCGWVDQEDLAHDPSMAPPRLNIDVFRIRKQFETLGVVDAAKIVERRLRPAQLRIGTGQLAVTSI
jgi:hypothetical protein